MQSVKFYKVKSYYEYFHKLVHTFDRSINTTTYEYSRVIFRNGMAFDYILKKMFPNGNEVNDNLFIFVNKNLFETDGHVISDSSFFGLKVIEKLNNNAYNVEIYLLYEPELKYVCKIEIETENFLD